MEVIIFHFYYKFNLIILILGSLTEWIKNDEYKLISMKQILKYSIQIASGIEYCHSCNILHGDLKSGNSI